jgi:hypothetical protein
LTVAAGRSEATWLAGGLGAGGIALLAAGLATSAPSVLTPALLALAGSYTAVLLVDGTPLDRRAPAVAALLLATAETAFRALEVRTTSPDERGATRREIARTAVASLLTLGGGLVLIAVADGLRHDGVAAELVAAGAVITAAWLLLRDGLR